MIIIKFVDRAIALLGSAARHLAVIAIVALLGIGVADVVGTQLFGKAVPSAIELQEAFAAVLIFCGFAVAQIRKAHLTVDVLIEKADRQLRRWMESFALVTTAIVFALLTAAAFSLAERSFLANEMSPGFLSFPLYPFKIIACGACFVSCLETLRQLGRVLAGVADRDMTRFDQREIMP